ncbi:MAG: hypothetical protein DMD72_06710 [Gemmatimonadetes bacterium]|nr:MAG: hypothetical protein DMD72_06710 [Gemmatimonadota bacterium]
MSETARAGRPENPQTWAPERLSSVNGVPATEIEAQVKTRLAGARPPKIDDEQWGHTRRLYKTYGDNPLWLSADGLHKTRTKALTDRSARSPRRSQPSSKRRLRPPTNSRRQTYY